MRRYTSGLAGFLLILSGLLFCQNGFAQNWTHSWGGTATETGNAVATDSQGNVYVAGSTTSFGAGGQDVLLLKYSPSGTLLWARTWGGPGNDFANGILVGSDGSAYVVGGTASSGAGSYDVLVLKFDTNGNWQWTRTWGGGSYDVGYDVSLDQSGNLAIAAESYSYGNAVVLLRMATDGTLLSATTWKGPGTYDSGYSITVDSSGNIIITGTNWDYSVSPVHNTILIVKFNSSGAFTWNRIWAGPSQDEAFGRKVVRTDAQGNIYILGHTSESCNTDSFGTCVFDALLLKIDPTGNNLLLARRWGGTGTETPGGLWLEANGQIDVAATTTSYFGGLQAALVQQYDASGNVLTSKVLATSAASGWNSLTPKGNGVLIATGIGPNNGGTWQDTGTPSVIAPGGLSTPTYALGNPAAMPGSYTGTVTDPTLSGVQDTGGGGTNALTGEFSFGGSQAGDVPLSATPLRDDPSLVAYYPFDGNSQDATGHYNGTNTNIVYGGGRFGLAAGFDGTSSTVSMGNVMDLSNTAPFSISVWFRTTTASAPRPPNSLDDGAYAVLVSKEDINPPYVGWRLLMNDSIPGGAPGHIYGDVGVQLYSGWYQQLYTMTPNTYNDGYWHLAVATYDGSGNNSGLKLYMDGSLTNPTITVPQNTLGAISNPHDFNIGAVDDAYGFFDGSIDDVAIFSRELTAGEIGALYTGIWAVAPVIPGPPPAILGLGGTGTGGTNAGSTTAFAEPNNVTVQTSAAEPVSTGNGNYYYQHTDFAIPSRGLQLVFQRNYNALDNYAGPLGANWTHSLNVVLTQTASGVANIRWGDGHGEAFTLTGTTYLPQVGVLSSFAANADGTYTLTQKSHTKFNFSAAGKLTSVQDRNGNTLQLSYDGSGNLVAITAPGGRELSIVYDTSGRITTVTDPMGRTETYSYDGSNNLATATDPLGGVTTYTYDSNHHVTKIALPNGSTLLQNAYDAQGRVVSQTNGRGFTWQFAYNTPTTGQTTITDVLGNATIHTYDSSLRIVGITDAAGHTTSYTYDANNSRTGVTNQNGNTTTLAYDAHGNLTGLTDPLADVTAFTYDTANDLLTVTNPKAKTTNFSYDSASNLTAIQDALGNKTALAYDLSGELISKTDARGNTTKFQFSSSGDLASVTDALGKSTNLTYDGDGRLVSLTDPSLHTATSAYDALGRLTQVSDALGDKTQFSYDAVGNLLSVKDANGHTTSYSYDATNNLVSVTDALGHVTKYAYDADNNRVGFTNAKGNSTSYQFDSLNRLTRSVDPLGFVTAYSYDGVGNVAAVTDAKGQTNKFAYDVLNHLLSIAYADQKNVAYAYDADGNRTSMIDWTGTTSYSYDALDRLTSVAFPGNKTVAYGYNANGRRATLTYPSGQSVSFSYDADERLATVTDWLSHATQYTFDPSGNLARVQYPNSARIDFTYDPANRLTSVINTTVGVRALAFDYALDPVGNRTKVTEAGIPTLYGYDALNQLTTAQIGPLKTSWTYDAVGNRLSEVSPFGATRYSYDASDRLLTAGTRTFTYDPDGNEGSSTDTFAHIKHTYSFNAANRLVSVDGGLATAFVYDGDGNRISQSTGGLKQNYVNDIAAGLPVVLQDAIGGGPTSSYVYGLNLIEAFQPLSNDFYHYDGLGSTVLLTDIKGHAEAAYLYDAWGNSLLPALPTNPFRFTGQALDPTTGLYYLRARYYDPTLGRFVSKDPFLGLPMRPLTLDRFAYGLNRPTNLFDPSGFAAEGSSPGNVAELSFITPSTGSLTNASSTVSRAIPNPSQNPTSSNPFPSVGDFVGETVSELPDLVPATGAVVSYLGAATGSSALIDAGFILISPEAIVAATEVSIIYELAPVAFAPIPVAH